LILEWLPTECDVGLAHATKAYRGLTWSVRKVSDLWPGKRNWLTWSVGHL